MSSDKTCKVTTRESLLLHLSHCRRESSLAGPWPCSVQAQSKRKPSGQLNQLFGWCKSTQPSPTREAARCILIPWDRLSSRTCKKGQGGACSLRRPPGSGEPREMCTPAVPPGFPTQPKGSRFKSWVRMRYSIFAVRLNSC